RAKAATGVLPGLLEPPLDDRFERRGVDVVELVPALTAGLHEARGLQDVEVLRDRLPRRAKPVLRRQARADLKERLPVPVGQLVEDRAAGGIGQGLENVTHTRTLCKLSLACQHQVTRYRPLVASATGLADPCPRDHRPIIVARRWYRIGQRTA